MHGIGMDRHVFSKCQCLLCQIDYCSNETNGNGTTGMHEPNRFSNEMTKSEEKKIATVLQRSVGEKKLYLLSFIDEKN